MPLVALHFSVSHLLSGREKDIMGRGGGEKGKDGEEKNNRAEVNRDVTENRSQFLFIDIETRRGEKKKGKSLFDGLY